MCHGAPGVICSPGNEAVGKPSMEGGKGKSKHLGGFLDRDQSPFPGDEGGSNGGIFQYRRRLPVLLAVNRSPWAVRRPWRLTIAAMTLQTMRSSDSAIHYLVGTAKGRLNRLEKEFLEKPWQQVRDLVNVKLVSQEGELYIMARSGGRVAKEWGIRRCRLKKLWNRVKELQSQTLTRDNLLLKLGAAKKEAGRAYSLVEIRLPKAHEAVNQETFTFRLRKNKLRTVRRREGCYLLRSNFISQDPAKLWEYYIQLTEIEQAFKEIKHDLSVRPIYHQIDKRIDAHIFVSFVAYCLLTTLKHRAKQKAPGSTPRSMLEKFAAMQMVDVHLPTTDHRLIVLPRYTQPDPDQRLLLAQLKLVLPDQLPPRVAAGATSAQ